MTRTIKDEEQECAECGEMRSNLVEWGDRGEMPGICGKCYFNPGWYHEEDE